MLRVGRVHASKQAVAVVNGFQAHHVQAGLLEVGDDLLDLRVGNVQARTGNVDAPKPRARPILVMKVPIIAHRHKAAFGDIVVQFAAQVKQGGGG